MAEMCCSGMGGECPSVAGLMDLLVIKNELFTLLSISVCLTENDHKQGNKDIPPLQQNMKYTTG